MNRTFLKKHLLVGISIFFLLLSCGKDIERFIPDSDFSGLPAYDENGPNTAGVILDGLTWNSKFDHHIPGPGAGIPTQYDPLCFYTHRDSVWLVTSGELRGSQIPYMFLFYIEDLKPDVSLTDLQILDDYEIALNHENAVLLSGERSFLDDTLGYAINGTLHIKRFHSINSRWTIAGLFDAEYETAEGIKEAKNGRFGFRIRYFHLINIDKIMGEDKRHPYTLRRSIIAN